tara:strand:+ start:7 stop:1542 length:1536 start_codon:yes stop_codon:yes gene_type:complete
MTKARDIADFKFENIVDTGTEGTKVATGTTAQRGSTQGQIRFNSTTGLAEYYTGTEFKSIDSPPVVQSISPTTQADANANVVITGSGFSSGATVKFIGNDGTEYNSPSVTVNSNTQITATTPATPLSATNEPYDIKVINVSGLSATLGDSLDAGGVPVWNTASGQIGGSLFEGDTVNITNVTASDPDGTAVTYSETTSNVLGANGLSLNSSTGAITGTLPSVSNDTTISFTLRASAGSDNTDRAFNIVNKNFSVTDINSIPENVWSSIPTGQFPNASTYTDYYGGRFEVLSGNIMKFMQQYSSEHVMYQRANSRSNSNEECYIQMYDIQTNLAQTGGNAYVQFGLVYDDPTNVGVNNNTMFGYVPSSYVKSRYVVFGDIDGSTNHGFYHGSPNAQSNASISNATTNRDSLQTLDLDSYQLNFTPTSASTRTAITFVVKPDNHSSNARKVYVYYGNTKVHTFSNLVDASSPIHFYVAIGHNTDNSSGDNWTNNPPRIRYGDNNGNADYDVGG